MFVVALLSVSYSVLAVKSPIYSIPEAIVLRNRLELKRLAFFGTYTNLFPNIAGRELTKSGVEEVIETTMQEYAEHCAKAMSAGGLAAMKEDLRFKKGALRRVLTVGPSYSNEYL